MILEQIPFIPSPNFSSRQGFTPSGIVLHYTATKFAMAAKNWFLNPDSNVSAHFIIDRDGTTLQMVNLEDAAWHAGKALMEHEGRLRGGVNRFTIGIELVNRGRMNWDPVLGKRATLKYSDGQYIDARWEEYDGRQMSTLERLVFLLKEKYKIENVMGHDEIAFPIGRKSDPGPLFDWSVFGRGVGTRKTRYIVEGVET